VTLVLTDVQGSTSLWERAPELMREALRVHDDVLRRLLATHRGYEVRTEGDAFVCAFADPVDAALFCLRAQETLAAAP
jgi:class 3 adenylate cyclase